MRRIGITSPNAGVKTVYTESKATFTQSLRWLTEGAGRPSPPGPLSRAAGEGEKEFSRMDGEHGPPGRMVRAYALCNRISKRMPASSFSRAYSFSTSGKRMQVDAFVEAPLAREVGRGVGGEGTMPGACSMPGGGHPGESPTSKLRGRGPRLNKRAVTTG